MMKITGILLFFFSFINNAYSAPAGWKLLRDNGIKVWQLKSNSNVSGSLERKKHQKQTNWSKLKKKSYMKKLEEKKKKVLELIGISDWRTDSHKWKKINNSHLLNITGRYTDSSGQKTAFTEIHIYNSNETIKMLYTRPQSIENGEKLSETIIDHMKKEAGVK
ncbi:MAG: hypothetical protein OXB84_05970 [Halobacteriovoraceae bacterium]|nr:hypothetical protein [Halobacteriovoraceae bacterium]